MIVKPTNFRKDQILVSVQVGGGRLDLPLDKANTTWASSAYLAGGFKGLSLEDSQRALAGRIYGSEFAIGNQAFDLHGATRPRDLATQLQVLTAYLADPGFRSEAFERVRTAYLAALPQLEATPDGVVNRDFEALLRNGDPRWAFPSKDEIQTAKPTDLSNLLGPALGSGPIEITIVGDVTADKTIAEVAATLGALPARAARIDPAPNALKVRFPAPVAEPVRRNDTGRPDQAVAIIAWPLTDFYADMPASRAANMAGEVLQNRILDEVRIKQGATYSPQVEVSLSETFPAMASPSPWWKCRRPKFRASSPTSPGSPPTCATRASPTTSWSARAIPASPASRRPSSPMTIGSPASRARSPIRAASR